MIEFVKPGSDIEGEINRVLIKEMEKKKYRPTDIVSEVNVQGFPRFTQHQHTLFMKERKSRDPTQPFGTFVDIQKKDWRWYGTWLNEVLAYCESNRERFGPKPPPSTTQADEPG